jgi:hypothetical protein
VVGGEAVDLLAMHMVRIHPAKAAVDERRGAGDVHRF